MYNEHQPAIRNMLNNLQIAYDRLHAAPEDQLDLDAFLRIDAHCNTLYCAAGLLTTEDHFQLQGMVLVPNEEPHPAPNRHWLLADGTGPYPKRYAYDYLIPIFGRGPGFVKPFDCLFLNYGEGMYDDEIFTEYLGEEFCWAHGGEDQEKPLSDKELILRRIRHHIDYIEMAIPSKVLP